jgi:Tfp pilus assembly ATPase PilU
MVVMDQRLIELYQAGLIDREEFARRISSPAVLRDLPEPTDGGGEAAANKTGKGRRAR